MRRIVFGLLACFFFGSSAAHAVTIIYDIEQDESGDWRYVYTVKNDSGIEFDGLTIYFDPETTANVAIADSPEDWDGLVLLFDDELPAVAGADWLNFGPVLALGDTVGGFMASFTWTGPGTPPAQFFELHQFFELYTLSFGPGCDEFLGCFDIVFEGVTVPEPGSLVLLATILLLLLYARRRRSSSPEALPAAT